MILLRCFPFANVPITELKDDLGLVEVEELGEAVEVDLDEVGTILLVFLAL